MSYLAIDPGISTGWARIDQTGALVECGRGDLFPVCIRAIIELPQVYRASASPTNPDDLIKLAVRVGQYKERLEVAGARVELVKPASWKGQVSKAIHHPRIHEELTLPERMLVARKLKVLALTEKKAEDVWDAIGLVKWAWGHNKFKDTSTTLGRTAGR